jgi:serine/threonine protein kinase
MTVWREGDRTKRFARKAIPRTDDAALERWKNEVRCLMRARESDPHHVIKIESAFYNASHCFIVMPLAEEDLSHRLNEWRSKYTACKTGDGTQFAYRQLATTRRSIMKWTCCLLKAISYLHTSTPPIIHRDIKPANILIREEEVVLVDFGIAFVKEGGTKTGASTTNHGTLKYDPPEASENSWWSTTTYYKTKEKGDIFSLGCVFFEMLQVAHIPVRYDSGEFIYKPPMLTAKSPKYADIADQISRPTSRSNCWFSEDEVGLMRCFGEWKVHLSLCWCVDVPWPDTPDRSYEKLFEYLMLNMCSKNPSKRRSADVLLSNVREQASKWELSLWDESKCQNHRWTYD